MKTRALVAATVVGLALCSLPRRSSAQNSEADQNFKALVSDSKPRNCGRATDWFIQRADEFQQPLLDHLYTTKDWQCRDAIFHILFNAPSFTGDARFQRFVIERLPQQNRHVANHSIFNSEGVETDRVSEDGVHWEAWKYINNHFDSFAPLLRTQVATTDNEWIVWATAWLLKHRGILEQNRDWFTPAVLKKAAANLKNDGKQYNASQAVRLFFLLGEQGIPVLQDASKSSDSQARDLARATLDAFKENHDAIGFLTARVNLDEVLFGEHPESPEWMEGALQPYLDNKKPYRGR